MTPKEGLIRGPRISLTAEELLTVVRATCRSWELAGVRSIYMRRHAVADLAKELGETVDEAADVLLLARSLIVSSESVLARDVTAFWVLGLALVPFSTKVELVQAATLDAVYMAWIEAKGVSVPDRVGVLMAYSESILMEAIDYLSLRVTSENEKDENVAKAAEKILTEALRSHAN